MGSREVAGLLPVDAKDDVMDPKGWIATDACSDEDAELCAGMAPASRSDGGM